MSGSILCQPAFGQANNPWWTWLAEGAGTKESLADTPVAACHSPPESIDDRTWIAQVQNGDEDAARALVRRLYPTIIRSIRCHLPKRTSEDDLAQMVFTKIFTRLHQFSGLVPLEHWVSRIAINTCLNHVKHEKRRPELRMADLTEEEQAVVQQIVSTSEDLPGDNRNAARELVNRLLAVLKPDERLVVTLLHLEERSVAEVGRRTGWSLSRVKVKAFRARLKMRRFWERTVQHHEL